MKVSDLIEFLKTKPQDIEVAIEMYSEQCLLEVADIKIHRLVAPRPDGWIQNRRDDQPLQDYLVFPGN